VDLQLAGKRAVVTGGSRGIGFAIATALAAEGVDVALLARDPDLLAAVDAKVLGYLRCARAAAPHMIAQGWGRIINIGGLAARSTGLPSGSIRNIGVAAVSKSLADELGPAGINVTVVHPGMTRTERTPVVPSGYPQSSIGRVVTAAEVADVVTFLASPRSVAINGDTITAGGGTPGVIYY
jgi:NAD(P)-dependent dehydrogenase (short-subunit alcohol dehydrogenase family)